MADKNPPQADTLLRYAEPEVVWGGFFHLYLFSKYIKVFIISALRETRYCAKAEPEVICDGLFLLCPLCLYIKVFSTFALEKLLRYAEPEVFSRGAISFLYLFTLRFLVHRCRGKLLRWSGANVLNILDGAVRFCENDAGELLMYIEVVLWGIYFSWVLLIPIINRN